MSSVGHEAHWRLESDETELSQEKFLYKFHVKWERPPTLFWFEVFVPDPPATYLSYTLRHWPVPKDGLEHNSPVFELDPAVRGVNGHYLVLQAMEIINKDDQSINKLNVAKMRWKADGTEVLSGTPEQPVMNPANTEDRFYVRVIDPSQRGKNPKVRFSGN